MPRLSAGAIAAVGYAVIGLAWTALELRPQGVGFEDTDDPAVSLEYLRAHAEVYGLAGLALFAMSIAFAVVVFATADILAGRTGSMSMRVTTGAGLLAAGCMFLFGVLRYGVKPTLYITELDQGWGESAYLVIQMMGIHGIGQAAILTSSAWAVAVAVLGLRAGVIPRWLAALALLPAVRLTGLVGPFIELPGELWVVYMLAIPGTFVWFGLLGLSILRRHFVSTTTGPSPALAEA